MEQIFIRIKKGEDIHNKDILNSNYDERENWYRSLSKGQVIHVLEQFVENKITEENLR